MIQINTCFSLYWRSLLSISIAGYEGLAAAEGCDVFLSNGMSEIVTRLLSYCYVTCTTVQRNRRVKSSTYRNIKD